MKYRAVIFDLWQTLVPWPHDAAESYYRWMADAYGAPYERFHDAWLSGDHLPNRNTGPASDYFHALFGKLGVDADVEQVLAMRRERVRRCSFLDPTRCRHSMGFAAAAICSG